MTPLRVVVGTLLLIAAVSAVLLLSGVYDIGADVPHWRWIEQLASAVRNASIAARAADIKPPDLNEPARIAEGARHYSQMCAGCHLEPGIDESEIRKGLYPRPPDLRRPPHRDPGWQFWVVKHGVKMSAMPAWGSTHDDAALWGIVAFLQKLPSLSAAEYRALAGEAGRAHGHAHEEHDGDEAAPLSQHHSEHRH